MKTIFVYFEKGSESFCANYDERFFSIEKDKIIINDDLYNLIDCYLIEIKKGGIGEYNRAYLKYFDDKTTEKNEYYCFDLTSRPLTFVKI